MSLCILGQVWQCEGHLFAEFWESCTGLLTHFHMTVLANLWRHLFFLFQVTTRLSAVETLPTNRLLNHGAQYIQNNFSSWVQDQGGYVRLKQKPS